MARIEGEIVIGRPVDVVFDYVADQSNERQYNPQMVRAEKITAGPVGKGTRFRSAVASRGRTAEMLIECTGYDRPALFATTTTMAQADISYTLRFEPVAAGTRMRWSGHVRPKGAFRLLGPVITWMGIRQEQRIWASLKNTWKQHRQHQRGRNRQDRTGSERTGQGAVAHRALVAWKRADMTDPEQDGSATLSSGSQQHPPDAGSSGCCSGGNQA